MIDIYRERQREKRAPCREPDAGLDPRTPGSAPGPKAGAKLLSHPGIPVSQFYRDIVDLQNCVSCRCTP